jgi:hypothetical protein
MGKPVRRDLKRLKFPETRLLGDGALIVYRLGLIGQDEFARIDSKLRAVLN